MFFASFVGPFVVSATRALARVRPASVHVRAVPARFGEGCAHRVIGVAVRAHLLLASSRRDTVGLVARDIAGSASAPHRLGRFAIQRLHRVVIASARASLRAAFAGRPFTPGGYAVLAAMVTAVALVALFSTSSASADIEAALRLGWWF